MDIMGTTFVELNDDERRSLFDLDEYGYVFDWTRQSSYKSSTVAALLNGEVAGLVEFERHQGKHLNYVWSIEVAEKYKGSKILGKLVACVARDSIEQGFGGSILFNYKTPLSKRYSERLRKHCNEICKTWSNSDFYSDLLDLRAELHLDPKTAQSFVERYLGGE